MLEELLRLSNLYDFYGALLTDKQQQCFRMHLFEDLSLSEIGEALGISRQAVYDLLHRGEQSMEGYENKLGLVARHQKEHDGLRELYKSIAGLKTTANAAAVDDVLKSLAGFLHNDREV